MKEAVIGRCVRGSSHVRSGTECQDSRKTVELPDGTIIMVVADGHGSKSCPYSKTGSRIAVNVFCDVFDNVIQKYPPSNNIFAEYLNWEGKIKTARDIDLEWKKRVVERHKANKRPVELDREGNEDLESIYNQYGTTLLGLVITKTFVFAFQLGDGDICFVRNNELTMLVAPEKILGVETHSLSKRDAWKETNTAVWHIELETDLPAAFTLSTDGFANSYKSEEDFHEAIIDYVRMIGEHGTKEVSENLRTWLDETSRLGCGDDITLQIAYYSSDNAEVEVVSDQTDEEDNDEIDDAAHILQPDNEQMPEDQMVNCSNMDLEVSIDGENEGSSSDTLQMRPNT